MKRVFSSFQDAAKFSRSLAMNGIQHQLKRNGNAWEVHYAENKPPDTKQEQITQKLKKVEEENENLRVTIDQKAEALSEQKNRECDVMLTTLSRDENERKLLHQKTNAENKERLRLSEESLRLAEQRALDMIIQVTDRIKVFEALTTAYTQEFGEAEVTRVTKKVSEISECSRCNGTGKEGRCELCGGGGIFRKITEVPYYKATLFEVGGNR